MTKIELYTVSLIIMTISILLILTWFNWKLLVVLFLFSWGDNLSKRAEIK